jgi:NtrC-family two-component system sensor histidine kinase KinB
MHSLSQKIGLGYFVIICINIALAVFAIFNINDLSRPIDQILKEKYQNVSAAENMMQALSQQELAQLAMVEDGYDSTLAVSFQNYRNEFLNWHQRAIEGIALPSEPQILDSLLSTFTLYIHLSAQMHEMLNKGEPYRQIKNFHFSEILPLVKELNRYCSQLKDVNEQAIKAAELKSQSISGRANWLIITFSLILISVSILAGIYFTQRILKPVKQTTETVRRISRGQFNQKIDITTDDEIAELGIEFNRMTERLQTYEQMNIDQILLEKSKTEALVTNIPVAIFLTDPDYRFTLLNESAINILQISDQDWYLKKVDKIVKEDMLKNFLMSNMGEDRTSSITVPELITIQRYGSEVFYHGRQIRLKDKDQKEIGKVSLLQDVTSFKNLDRLKSEFIATISHELKTPLTSINMAVDILLRGVSGTINNEQRELLEGAKEDGQRLKNFTRDLLDISKLESGKFKFNFTKVNLEDIIDHAVNPLHFRLEEKQIDLTKNIDHTLPEFTADGEHLTRVISNLVENAIQHTPEHGEIKISATRTNKVLQVCVADTGEGIPDEAQELIFDKFIQVKNFQQSEMGNIGLGLAISREIIQAHKGRIWVKSKPGEGSRFYFEIPLKKT